MYANYTTMQCDAETIKFFSLINNPSRIEQKAKVEDLPSYLNTDYALSSLNNENVLQYTGHIAKKQYPLSMIKEDITMAIESEFQYEITKVHISNLKEDNEKFTVFTIEINESKPDYALFLEQEYKISEKLELDKKNIILRLI